MKKYFTLLVVASLFTAASNAQSIEQKIEQAAKDKKRAENAAKADVLVVDKKNVFDSSSLQKEVKPFASKTKVKKQKKCGHRKAS